MQAALPIPLAERLADLYRRMEEAYERVAATIDFSCSMCPDNCCDSYFQHHTYVEWAYLWNGLAELPQATLVRLVERAADHVDGCERSLAAGERPRQMCPLNDAGLCGLYRHRLMICRMHGIPSAMTRPDGRRLEFPGCFLCQQRAGAAAGVLDRTDFYRELVALEGQFLATRRMTLPRLRLTIAEMIVRGAPRF
ncbi:MAG: hypothetical protein AB1568_15490 [Thermodesulfobacteriota bacterium]